jgi:hypothetical protein
MTEPPERSVTWHILIGFRSLTSRRIAVYGHFPGVSAKALDVILHPSQCELLIKQASVDYTVTNDLIASKKSECTKLHNG